MTLTTHGKCQRFFDAPFKRIYALMNGRIADTCSPRQIFQRAGMSIEREQLRPTLIFALDGCGSPSAIIRLIVAAGINAVNGMFLGWFQSHIGKEVVEGFKPTLADGYTKLTIALKIFTTYAVAAFSYIAPCLVFWRMGHAVGRGSFAQLLDAEASARIRASEVVALHRRFLAAVTATAIFRMLWIGLRLAIFQNDEAAESLTGRDASHKGSIPYFALCLGDIH